MCIKVNNLSKSAYLFLTNAFLLICIYQTCTDAAPCVSAGVKCLCAVNQAAAQTGCPTNRYRVKCSLCTRPTALCSAFPSPPSLPHTPETLCTTLNQTMDGTV